MGNFYVNLTLRAADAEQVTRALEDLGRDAFVAGPAEGWMIIYDALCDTQSEDEIVDLGQELTRRLGAPALAVLNHDDDVLACWLFAGGRLLDRCESPSSGKARGGDAPLICATLGVDASAADVERALRAPRTFAIERHLELCALLGLPQAPAGLGFRHVLDGELAELEPDLAIVRVGEGEDGSSSDEHEDLPPSPPSGWFGVDRANRSLGEERALLPNLAMRPMQESWFVSRAAIPAALRQAIDDAAVEMARLDCGFDAGAWWHAGSEMISANASAGHALVSRDGRTLAIILAIEQQPPRAMLVAIALQSRRSDGEVLGTVDQPALQDPQPRTDRLNLPGATKAELLARHEARLAGHSIEPFADAADVASFVVRRAREAFDGLRRRGTYIELTQRELAIIRRNVASEREDRS